MLYAAGELLILTKPSSIRKMEIHVGEVFRVIESRDHDFYSIHHVVRVSDGVEFNLGGDRFRRPSPLEALALAVDDLG